MNLNDISTQLLYTTVPIYAKKRNGDVSSGTGFVFSVKESEDTSIPLLITNFHVLENAVQGFFELHIEENGLPSEQTVKVHFDESIINGNKLGSLDLIAVPLAATLVDFENKGIIPFYRSVNQNIIPKDEIEEFAAIEDIIFIGYPSGLYDTTNKLPIIRQGITATPMWNRFKGEDAFLIDAGVFPGSSGSPVFICNQNPVSKKNSITISNRLFFVGIISETMLRSEENLKSYLNLGKVINSNAMFQELEDFIEKLKEIR